MIEAKGIVEVIMLLPSQPAARVRRQAASVQTWSRRLVGLRQRKVSRGLSKSDKLSFPWQGRRIHPFAERVCLVCMYVRQARMYVCWAGMYVCQACMYVLQACMYVWGNSCSRDEVRFLTKIFQYLTFNSIF